VPLSGFFHALLEFGLVSQVVQEQVCDEMGTAEEATLNRTRECTLSKSPNSRTQ